MRRFTLVVADAARARIYTVEPVDPDLPGRGVALHERSDLVNSERRQRPGDLLSDTRPGTARSPTGLAFGVDDHREEHMRELDRRFAVEIASHTGAVLHAADLRAVVVIASPRMLGELRHTLPPVVGPRATVEELALDLTLMTTPQLHDKLADLGLVPARERAVAAR